MKLQRLAPNLAFAINQIITSGEKPEWFTKGQLTKTQKESDKFVEEHLKVKSFDVYLATTLRNLNDFISAEGTAEALESTGLSVAYPGGLGLAASCSENDSSNEKGDLERFFIEKSKSLLMFEAEKMSVGKYFEAAIAILSKKPVAIAFTSFKSRDEMKILRTRHPIKTLGGGTNSFGFHAGMFGVVLNCLRTELGMDERFSHNFRQKLNEVNTNRSRNRYCPLCKSLLERESLWINAKEIQKRLEIDFDEAIKE